MNRVHLWLAGLQVLSLVAIAWLWSENQSLRTQPDDGSDSEKAALADVGKHEGGPSVQREVNGSPKLGTRRQDPGDTRQTQN